MSGLDDLDHPKGGRPLLTEEHEAFRQTARTFVEKEVLPHHAQWEQDGIVPRELWTKAGEQGLLCFDVPEEYGGYSAGGESEYLAMVVATEELSRASLGGAGSLITRSTVRVVIMPSTTSASRRRRLWRAMFVRIPPTMNSSSARRIRMIASARVGACTMTFASSES